MAKRKQKKAVSKKQAKLDRIANIIAIKKVIKAPIGGVLAIDPATASGWAFSYQKKIIFGEFLIKKKGKDPIGLKWVIYEDWLNELFDRLDDLSTITNVVYEMPVTRFAGATIHHSKLACLIEKISAERNVPFSAIDPKTLKKFITGNGIASKELVMENIEKFHGYSGGNDDIADAIGILICKMCRL